eukprot:2150908-Alexandrium_andersonii.AAC.1
MYELRGVPPRRSARRRGPILRDPGHSRFNRVSGCRDKEKRSPSPRTGERPLAEAPAPAVADDAMSLAKRQGGHTRDG